MDKLRMMVEHWKSHNEDHAGSYRDWAARARNLGRDDVAAVLEEVAGSFVEQNEKLMQALKLLG